MQLLSFSMRGVVDWLRRRAGTGAFPNHVIVLLVVAFVMAGCGPGEGLPAAASPDAGAAACAPGEMPLEGGGCQPAGLPPDMQCAPGELPLEDGGCQPAGLPPDMQCPPGEMPLAGGGCQPAGVPPGACAQGFEPDGQGGCNAILPPDPCPPGKMAIPGETQCRDVAPCGTGDYGLIPVDATTQFVNAAYPGTDSDGTQAKPWKKIQHGINQAKVDGAIVAVAAGTYTEDLLIQGRPIRLWGRCPGMVEVVGTGATVATLRILHWHSSQTEVHSLAITGPRIGIFTNGPSDVVVDRAWIHDTMGRGLEMNGSLGASSIMVSASLIEATKEIGIFVSGSDATVEATAVRTTQANDAGEFGHGISVTSSTLERSKLTLRTSLLERHHEAGVSVFGSDATIEETVVRSTQVNNAGELGHGITVSYSALERSKLTLRASLLEQHHEVGVSVSGSDATIDATIVRATQPRSDGMFGRGIEMIGHPDTHEPSTLTLRTSLVEQNHDIGVRVLSSDATIDATIVRATQPRSDGKAGRGIDVTNDPSTHWRATLALRTSLVEQNHEFGVVVTGSDATIEASVVRATQPSDGTFGRGIELDTDPDTHERATATLRAAIVEQNHEVGVRVFGSDATIEASVVRDTQPLSDGVSGTGIEIQDDPAAQERATLTLRTSLVERNHYAGVAAGESEVTIDSTIVRATQPVGDGTFGRGIDVHSDSPTRGRANLILRSSLVEQNHEVGVFIDGSDTTIEGTVIRATQPAPQSNAGMGIVIQYDSSTQERATGVLRNSLLEHNHAAGVLIIGSDVTIEGTIVRNTQPHSDGTDGRGIGVQEGATLMLRTSRVEENHEVGVVIQLSDATIEETVVRATQPEGNGTAGDGIAVESGGRAIKVFITSSQIESNARAGIANISSEVILVSSRVQCNPINLNGEDTVSSHPFSFDGSKDNVCGCADKPDPTCPVRSSNLSPPDPITPPAPAP